MASERHVYCEIFIYDYLLDTPRGCALCNVHDGNWQCIPNSGHIVYSEYWTKILLHMFNLSYLHLAIVGLLIFDMPISSCAVEFFKVNFIILWAVKKYTYSQNVSFFKNKVKINEKLRKLNVDQRSYPPNKAEVIQCLGQYKLVGEEWGGYFISWCNNVITFSYVTRCCVAATVKSIYSLFIYFYE